jgi:anti-sigma regulatory factor (Ser/Thr protein kinase)
VVQCWTADGVVEVLAGRRFMPPTRLCFEDNSEETFSFLERWCKNLSSYGEKNGWRGEWINPPRTKRAMPRMTSYIDFSQLEYVSTAAALVMTAEFDRVATLVEKVPPAINLHQWHDGVFTKLNEMGFFENIGLIDELEEKFNVKGNIKTLKITSGRNAAELEEVSKKIIELCGFLKVKDETMQGKIDELTTGLGEAMINVARHAYPDDHEFERRHVDKWWVTAAADNENNILKVAIFDQGATIPITFPRKRPLVRIKESVTNAISNTNKFDFDSDGTYIHEAMQPGMTQTDQGHRGKGLPEMTEIVDALGNANITVYSRGGVCHYGHNGFNYRSQPHSVGGTLIEWTLRLDEDE